MYKGQPKGSIIDDAAVLGITFEDEPVSDDFEVNPENWEAVMMFLRVQTQFRTDNGYVVGLDYNVLFKVMELEKIKNPLDVLEDVQIIEARIIELLSERRK